MEVSLHGTDGGLATITQLGCLLPQTTIQNVFKNHDKLLTLKTPACPAGKFELVTDSVILLWSTS